MKVVKNCKLCKLGLHDPALLNKIHHLRFNNNLALRNLEDEVNKLIPLADKQEVRDIESVSYVALQNHLAEHTSKRLGIKYKAQCAVIKARINRESPLVNPEVTNEIKKYEKDAINLFENLTNLYIRLNTRFDDFDMSQGGKIKLGELPGEKGNLEGYSVLSKELRTCLVELNKMKQDEQLKKNIIHFTMKQYTYAIIEHIMRELDGLEKSLHSHIKNEEIVKSLVEMLRNNLATNLSKSANDVVRKVEGQFNVK